VPNTTLGELAKQDIREALNGLSGKSAAAEVQRLAGFFKVSRSRIYEIARDTRPKRKTRADKGKRRADLLDDAGLRFAAELVVLKHVDPDHALMTARKQGYEIPVSDATFVRYLREHGLSRYERENGRRGYRPFEAKAPGEIFQIDISGVKTRWLDLRTRRILRVSELEVSPNHPNQNPNRVPLWKFALIDDYSRYKYVRFYAINYPTQSHIADFCLGAFREMGIPLMLYSDNDTKITGQRMQHAASLLNQAFADSGGFRLEQHEAGNAQASGKVERLHKIFEKFEKLIGVRYQTPGLEELNNFCRNVCEALNWKKHRTTGVEPAIRFNSTHRVLRVPPPAVLDGAFKADRLDCKLEADFTVSFGGARYQVPRERPFSDWINQMVKIVWIPEADFFVLIGLDKNEYEIEKKLAAPDAAGEYKQAQESKRQRATKALKESAKERKRLYKDAGRDIVVPYFASSEEAASHPITLPKRKDELPAATLNTLSPGSVPPSYSGRLIDYWTALAWLVDEGLFANPASQADKDFLSSIFDGRSEITDTEMRARLAERPSETLILPMQRSA
jgi:hypothetical protein